MATKWQKRWRYELAPTTLPGVYRVKTGGLLVRGRAVQAQTGKQVAVMRRFEEGTALDVARAWLAAELERVRTGRQNKTERQRFSSYAASLLARKIDKGRISSEKTVVIWRSALANHLIPRWGDWYVDAITRQDIEDWLAECAKRIDAAKKRTADYERTRCRKSEGCVLAAGHDKHEDERECRFRRKKGEKRREVLSPVSVNGWLRILMTILRDAVKDLNLERDPTLGVEPLDTSTHRTYTRESPNSLRPEDVPRFLAEMKTRYPQHYAFVLLGFSTGLRPSTLRPLRRSGPERDYLPDERVLLVRRSQTVKDKVMNATKTKKDQWLALPDALVKELDEHVTALAVGGDLLFPARGKNGRPTFRSGSSLDKPFAVCAEAIGLPYRFTVKGMRRTFQDLCRAAHVEDIVARSVSGHATEEMQRHYSTVDADEQRTSIAKVINIATRRSA